MNKENKTYTNAYKSMAKDKKAVIRTVVINIIVIMILAYLFIGMSLGGTFGIILSLVSGICIGPQIALFMIAIYKAMAINEGYRD